MPVLHLCGRVIRTGLHPLMCVPDLGLRGDLMVLYAFNVEVVRAPWVTQEEMIAEMRLQWWVDAIEEIFKENKQVRRHEVVSPLAEVVAKHGLDRSVFEEIIEARRFDIYREGHGSEGAFDDYINVTSGHVMALAGQILGARDPEPFRLMGYASGVANLMVALPELYVAGRRPFPLGDFDPQCCD